MENSGALFKNDRKTEDRHPDYRGDAEVGGKKYWLSAWIKVAGPTAKNPGSKYMSLAFTAKDGSGTTTTTAPISSTIGEYDIPF